MGTGRRGRGLRRLPPKPLYGGANHDPVVLARSDAVPQAGLVTQSLDNGPEMTSPRSAD